MKNELKNTEYGLEKIFKDAKDFLPLLGTDYIEFYPLIRNKYESNF